MTNRREFLQYTGAVTLTAAQPSWAQETLRTRPIPGTDENLAVIGLGNSSAFRSGDRATSERLLDLFLSHGGNYVDVGGSSATLVGDVGQTLGRIDQLFLANYLDPGYADQERARAIASAQNKSSLDLVHTRDLAGFRSRHDSYRALKDEGLVRFIGVARTGSQGHAAMASLVEDGLVDFIQVNYSMLEPEAGERVLPLAMDHEVGVAISRPFLNGNYFSLIRGHELPEWAAEFDCNSWAQFSLKFILSHAAVNCVLTETANPDHAIDNIGGGLGRLPDEAMRQRMLRHMRSIL